MSNDNESATAEAATIISDRGNVRAISSPPNGLRLTCGRA
jgi:hypothetical protein